ncbi:pseudouridine synthase [Candidatus Omnitrophota bacterium]
MRLQVFLSKAGVFSRRAAVGIVASGRITVNGQKVFKPSFSVDPEKDRIFFNGKRIAARKKVYIMLHKPKGVTSTKKDPFATRTVMDLLPDRFFYLNPVGRLDKDTTGLILLTNDGELINNLTHPRFNVDKTYAATLDKKLLGMDKIKIEKGIDLDGKYTAPCSIMLKSRKSVEITMREGRKRQIRRMFLNFGYKVVDLKRLKEGFLDLGALAEGKWRFLTKKETDCFLNLINPQ